MLRVAAGAPCAASISCDRPCPCLSVLLSNVDWFKAWYLENNVDWSPDCVEGSSGVVSLTGRCVEWLLLFLLELEASPFPAGCARYGVVVGGTGGSGFRFGGFNRKKKAMTINSCNS